MSHRTNDLPPLTGVSGLIRELRYHEGSRQGLALVLIVVYALVSAPQAWLVWAALPLVVTGTLVRVYASGFIVKNNELATHGPYSFVRHPLYTGNLLLIIGFSAANGYWWAPLSALLFFWFYYPAAIEYEDRKLHRLFGAEWERWAARTPALLPTFGAGAEPLMTGGWSLAKSMRRNGEPVIAIFVAVCFALLVRQVV